MSARKGRKIEDKGAEPPSDAPEPAVTSTPSDDEIEILEVVGVNETETPERAYPAPAPQAPSEPVERASTAELEEAVRERDHYHDLWLRQQAEFDSFRKRADRDAAQRRLSDAADLIRRLLPVLDNLESAVGAAGVNPDDPVRRGLELIQKQMLDLLGREGLVVIATVGTRFDPAHHEAVEVVRGDAASDGTILAEMRKGYMFKDRLIRAALVRVASGEGVSGEARDVAAAG
jgi:molecular chaperone GrpE